MYLNDLCTIPVNIAGNPAMSVPCGFSGGMPVGLQLIAGMFQEGTLLRAAHAYGAASGWQDRRPPLYGEPRA
jgi:aspartyl-tRNA(Asn)/glutamyl-tRNA(Gln) amidotransferase subunit A